MEYILFLNQFQNSFFGPYMTLGIVLGGKAKFIPQAMHFGFTILATDIILD